MEPGMPPPGEPALVIPDYDAAPPGPPIQEPGMPPPSEPAAPPPMMNTGGAFDGIDMDAMGVKQVATITLCGKRVSLQALGGAAL